MPHALQQTSTPPVAPSANDLAAQIRAQVNQQLKQAGMSDQAAKSAADAAAQGAQGITITKNGKVIHVGHNGQTTIAPVAPVAPIDPVAPVIANETGTSVPSDPPLDIPQRVENLGYGLSPHDRRHRGRASRWRARSAASSSGGRSGPRCRRISARRLERIEQGIESVSIEIERISESQRYLLKVQTPDRVEIPRSAG